MPGAPEYSGFMQATIDKNVLDRLLDPVARCLAPDGARRLVALRIDPATQRYLDDLAQRQTRANCRPKSARNTQLSLRRSISLRFSRRKLVRSWRRPAPKGDGQALRKLVRDRAHHRCEYCRLRQEHLPLTAFHVEHVVARKHHGDGAPENLALACDRHFELEGALLVGRTPTGRATVDVCNMNAPRRAQLRSLLAARGEFP